MKLFVNLVLISLLAGFSIPSRAANRFWVAAAPGNWNNTANWSATSGGAGGASVPGAGDAVTFNGGSVNNCTLNIAVSIASLNITAAYNGTVAQGANTIIISGAATFSGGVFNGSAANITISGVFNLSGALFTSTSGKLEFNNNAVFNSPTFIHNNGTVRFNGTSVGTPVMSGSSSPAFYILEFAGLAKNYNVTSTGNVQVANALNITGTLYCNLNTGVFDVAGDINITNTATGGGGTAMINLNGNGVQNFNGALSAGAGVLPQLTINNPTGSVNMSGFPGVANNFMYLAGTINSGSSTFCFVRGSVGSYSINCTPSLQNITILAASSALTLTLTGTITAAGDVTIAGGSNVTLNTGTLSINGDMSFTNTATGGGGTGVIIINGTGNQNIGSTGVSSQSKLPDVIINKVSGILTFPTLITVSGDWTYVNGGLDVTTNNSTIVFTNTMSITGTHTLNNVTFEAAANRTFTVSTGTLLTVAGTLMTTGTSNITLNTGTTAGTAIIEAQGDIIINNTGAGGGTGGILINGTGSQALTSTSSASQGRMPYITIQKAAGTLVLAGIISESRSWTYISGTVDAVTNTSTVVFGGNNLNITSAGMNFFHVTVTANTSTLINAMTVQGDLTINGTGILAPVSNTINLTGNWTNRGTSGFTESTSTIHFNGSSLQTISTPGGENFTNIIVNNSAAGVQLFNNVTIATGLNMSAGNIDLNGNSLTLGISVANPGTLSYTNGNIINTGTFIRWVRAVTMAAGSVAGLFPMGTAVDKRPFYVSAPVTAPTAGGTIAVSYVHATSNSAVTFSDGVAVVLIRKDLNWVVTTANGLAGGNYNLQVRGTGYGVIGNISDLRLTLINSVVATTGTNGGTTANPQVNRTGLSAANLTNTFYLASISNINSPLPVTFINFSALVINDQVRLDWETAAEYNNDHFTVQRSVDGVNWEDLFIIAGKNNSASNARYSSYDSHPLPGNSFYRLMQTDIDGRKSYTDVKKISINKAVEINIFPNPATNYITIESTNSGKMLVTLFNNNGQQMNVPVTNQPNKTIFNISSLGDGYYYLQFHQGNINETRKIIILK